MSVYPWKAIFVAHEVTKRVGKRAYRYRVENYRDPATSKVRSRWTYLGVVAPTGEALPPAKRAGAEATRERLIDAFEALAAAGSYRTITAGEIATRAGLAHGTFYRYFSDKRSLLLAAIDRVKRELERTRPNFISALGDRAAERARVRDWLAVVFLTPGSRVGLFRAYFDAADGDEEMRANRRDRIAGRIASLHSYFERLVVAGIAHIERPDALATALSLLVDGALREVLRTATDSGTVDGTIGTGVIDAFDRAIFGEI